MEAYALYKELMVSDLEGEIVDKVARFLLKSSASSARQHSPALLYSVSFDMKVRSFSPVYASHPVSFGKPSANPQDWQWMFYIFGDEMTKPGRQHQFVLHHKLQIFGRGKPLTPSISRTTEIQAGESYRVQWLVRANPPYGMFSPPHFKSFPAYLRHEAKTFLLCCLRLDLQLGKDVPLLIIGYIATRGGRPNQSERFQLVSSLAVNGTECHWNLSGDVCDALCRDASDCEVYVKENIFNKFPNDSTGGSHSDFDGDVWNLEITGSLTKLAKQRLPQ